MYYLPSPNFSFDRIPIMKISNSIFSKIKKTERKSGNYPTSFAPCANPAKHAVKACIELNIFIVLLSAIRLSAGNIHRTNFISTVKYSMAYQELFKI